MKFKVLLSATVVSALTASSLGQLDFKHVARFDLSADFGATSSLGNNASDVAFDGTSLYIAGYRSSTGSAGILKVDNWLGTGSKSTFFTQSNVLAGESKLDFAGGAWYYGFGLGQNISANSTSTGIAKIVTPGGGPAALTTNFGGADGILDAIDVQGTGTRRLDGFAVDPQGGLGVVALGRGFMFRRQQADGSSIANPTISLGNGWRDVAFNSSGNVGYFREDNDVLAGPRSSANANITNSNIVNNTDNTASQFMSLSFGNSAAGNLSYLAFNNRSGSQNQLFLTALDGTQTATQGSILSLTGTEAINGVAQAGFDSNVISSSTGSFGGKDYLFVVQGGSANIKLSVYEAVPEPATMAALGLGVLGLLKRRKKA